MHILVMAMNYRPERTGIAPFNTDLCEYLVSQGHQVSVLTAFPHYPEWKIHEGYRRKWFSSETVNGVRVYRNYVYTPQKRSTLRRILYDSSLPALALLRGLTIRKIDLVLVVSPPLQLGLAGFVLSRIKGAHYLIQVKDLVPDIAIALGMLQNPRAIRLARALEQFVYAKAEAILVLSTGFAENLKSKGVPDSKITVLPDWIDTRRIRPLTRNNEFRALRGIDEGTFLVLHAGNMGVKQKLHTVIDAAGLVAGRDVLTILVGDGTERPGLEAYARDKQAQNVRFLPLQPSELLAPMLSAADVLVLSQAADVMDMVVPSKLLTYMAAGRPVVATVPDNSEAARFVRESGGGLVLPPEKPQALAEAICRLREDPEMARRLGASGRRFIEEHFAHDRVLRRFGGFLSEWSARGGGRPADRQGRTPPSA